MRHEQALALAAQQAHGLIAHHGLIALRQVADEVVGVGPLGSVNRTFSQD
ncbi:hypothetical protein [Salinibacter sp.]|nr:hypothetical protein [Salinibacter sp.]